MKSSMNGKIFIDTNVLIYAHDLDAGKKHTTAVKIIKDIWESKNGVISTQVLQEFYVRVTSKIPLPLSLASAREIVKDFLKWKPIIIDGESILKAIEIQSHYRYSFWDSLILSAAQAGGASLLYSEDFQHGQIIAGVRIINPFK